MEKYMDLGLGTGVNSTDPNMWKNKIRKICVRRPNLSNTKNREENETVYRSETVSTVSQHRLEIQGKLRDPVVSQVKLSVNTEFLRREDTAMMTCFKKCHTSTVSFTNLGTYEEDKASENHFQIILCTWLQLYCKLNSSDSVPTGDKIVRDIEDYMGKSRVNATRIENACEEYIKKQCITHYVYSIDMGALLSAFCTMTDFQREIGSGIDVGAGNNILTEAKFDSILTTSTTSINKTVIGQPNGSMPEEVRAKEVPIAFTLEPIYSLLSDGKLKEALKKAVQKFVQVQDEYYIASAGGQDSSKTIYWKVNDQNQIVGTTNIEEAARFTVRSTNSKVHRYEIHITYSKDFYLTCNSDILGNSDGPLGVESQPDYRYTHFVLHQPLRHLIFLWRTLQFPCTNMPCTYQPQELSDWIAGKSFNINCSRQRFKIDGYLALEKKSQDEYKLISKGTPITAENYYFSFKLISIASP